MVRKDIITLSKKFSKLKKIEKRLQKFDEKKPGKEVKKEMLKLSSRLKRMEKKPDISRNIGLINKSHVHPREVFNNAIQANAAQVIIAHNHPSGDLEPSKEDIKITLEMIEAGKILGIEILDHLIVTKSEFLSFRQKGLVFD